MEKQKTRMDDSILEYSRWDCLRALSTGELGWDIVESGSQRVDSQRKSSERRKW